MFKTMLWSGACLTLAFSSAAAPAAAAAAYKVLYGLDTKTEGHRPTGRLLFKGGWLYGTTQDGGTYGGGTIFRYNPSSNVFSVLYAFTGGNDGCSPHGGLTFVSPTLLAGTTYLCGPSEGGTIFTFDLNSSTLATIKAFNGASLVDGYAPAPELVLGKFSFLYGVTTNGPYTGATIFSISPETDNFVVIHKFPDVAYPDAALVQGAHGVLFGSTAHSGDTKSCFGGCGTLFTVDPVTLKYSRKFEFHDGADGAYPAVALVSDGQGHLYGGTGESGAGSARGVIFRINDGSQPHGTGLGYTVEYTFGDSQPEKSLAAEMAFDSGSGLFYGVANGDLSSFGTIFAFNPNSNILTTLYNFTTVRHDGYYPAAGLTPDGSGSYFGTTIEGGRKGGGVIFKITPP